LGLVQWGGSWEPQQRRLEGLPWLGCLVAGQQEADAAASLRSACAARWAALEHQRLA
jgi:hypothetical protein